MTAMQQVKGAHAIDLLSKRNVVGVGLGHKVSEGVTTDDLCLKAEETTHPFGTPRPLILAVEWIFVGVTLFHQRVILVCPRQSRIVRNQTGRLHALSVPPQKSR